MRGCRSNDAHLICYACLIWSTLSTLHESSQAKPLQWAKAGNSQALQRSGALLCHSVWNISAATQQWQRSQPCRLPRLQDSRIDDSLQPQPAAAASAMLALLLRLRPRHAQQRQIRWPAQSRGGSLLLPTQPKRSTGSQRAACPSKLLELLPRQRRRLLLACHNGNLLKSRES